MAKDPYRFFRVEARELLEGLTQGFLELEKSAAPAEIVARLLRFAHTLKGASRVVKQPRIAELAHAAEDVLAPHRGATVPVPATETSKLLHISDEIADLLKGLGPTAGERKVALAPEMRTGESLLETTRVDVEKMDALLAQVSETRTQLGGVEKQMSQVAEAERTVDTLAKRLGTHPQRSLADDLAAHLRQIREGLQVTLGRTTEDLKQIGEQATQLRLQPASVIFGSLERSVRDAAQSLQKRVDFSASGGDIQLDGHVLLAVRDALLHVVRNAVAHGLETESERANARKPSTGRVTLQVIRRGDRITFRCTDDGRGIDLPAVRRSAVDRGVLSAGDAAKLSGGEVARLIFRAGVSTAAAVSEVSGRGVGLDVVRDISARCRGEVDVVTEPHRGTTLSITVPVSLSSVTALRLECAGQQYGIALDAVCAVLRLSPSDVARTGHGDSVVFEQRTIPFAQLASALGREQRRISTGLRSVIIVEHGGERVAIEVDRVSGVANVVVRTIPGIAGVRPVIHGAHLDADGHPIPVLDPKGLLDAARAQKGQEAVPATAVKPPVLVIDDSLTTRMLEQSILQSAGYEVDLATSGEEGLQKAQARRYGLFVVDVEMPGMTGFDFIKTTRADRTLAEIPAILVTSRNLPEDVLRGREVGAHAYIVKGEFDQQYFLSTIRGLMGG